MTCLVRRSRMALGGGHCVLSNVPLFLVMTLDRRKYEDERQHAEDDCLNEVEHALEQQQRDGQQHDGQRRDYANGHFTGIDVAEESHRERDWLDELEHQLDESDEHGDEPGAYAVLEFVEGEELPEIAADAELAEALDFEDDEGRQGEADGDVDVARGRAQELDLADGRN